MTEDERKESDNTSMPKKAVLTEWDAAYPCSLELEMKSDKGMFICEKQKPLGHFPIRADIFIEKLDTDRAFSSIIAKKFRKYNFIEFKAPNDELNIDTFIKGSLYAGHFKISAPTVDGYKMTDITYTFVRQAKPVKLMRQLEEIFDYHISTEYDGIYYVSRNHGIDYFFQIIVVSELDIRQCVWLGVMKKGITREEFLFFLMFAGTLEDAEDKRKADTINETVVKANATLIRKWKEEYPEMSDALREIMKDEIEQERTDAQIIDIKKLMKNLKLTAQEAMDALEIPRNIQSMYIAKL